MAGWWVVACALALQDAPIERTVDVTKAVVVLVNENVADGVKIGEHYAKGRGIPSSQICRVRTVADEVCTWKEFRENILAPLKTFLESRPDVVYVVPVYGIPVKTSEGDPSNDAKGGPGGALTQCVVGRDYACIDREIELLKQEHEIDGWLESKTFRLEQRITVEHGIYVVSRLDGPSAEAARSLVDNALYGEAYGVEGKMLIDTRGLNSPGDGYTECDQSMKACVKVCENLGIPFTHDDKPDVVDLGTQTGVSHYWSWYTGNVVCSKPDFRFARGAIGAHLHSFSAGNLRRKDVTWTGPLVHHGLTCTWGTVYEPLISGFPWGTMLFDRFFRGHTFGDSIQMANQMTSWQAVFVGDPLYAPYAAGMKERQAKNRETAKNAYVALAQALDGGDLAKADAIAKDLASIGLAYAGTEDPSFLLRELRARQAWPDRKAKGAVAELRAAVEAARKAVDAGDFKAGAAAAKRALDLSPANFESNLLAAIAAAETGGAKGALANLEVAEKVEATFAVLYWKARALRASGDRKGAIVAFEAALVMQFDVAALGQLGEVLVEERRYAEAIAKLEQAVKQKPDDREIAGELGRAYVATKEWKKAIATLEGALKDLPRAWPDVKDYVACTELLLAAVKGDGDKARAQALGDLVKELKGGKVKATPAAQAAKIDEQVDAGAEKAEKMAEVGAYDDKLAGIAKLRLATKLDKEVQFVISGPMSAVVRARGSGGKEKPQDIDLVPGIYRILVVTPTKSFFREQRIEAGTWYGLGVDEKTATVKPGE